MYSRVRQLWSAALIAAALLLAATAAGCGDDDGGGGDGSIGTLTLTATDFAFAVEGDLRPGPTKIVMPNQGEYEHYAFFFRIDEDHSPEDLFEPLASEESFDIPDWAELMGGPSILSPGETAELNVDFAPGRYAFLCPLAEPDGELHYEKGMYGEITLEGEESGGDLPAAAIEVTGEDDGAGESYAFGGLPETAEPGEALLQFENTGTEPHEMIVARTPDKFSLEETVGIFFEEVEPPEDFEYVGLGGPAPILPGDRQQLRVDFQEGSRYVFLCFLPNPEGLPHAALGMVGEITVPP